MDDIRNIKITSKVERNKLANAMLIVKRYLIMRPQPKSWQIIITGRNLLSALPALKISLKL